VRPRETQIINTPMNCAQSYTHTPAHPVEKWGPPPLVEAGRKEQVMGPAFQRGERY